MDDLMKRFNALKEKKRTYEDKLVKATTLAETSRKSYEDALATLQAEFGVSSLEEAQKLLSDTTADLENKVADLEKSLSEFEA